MKCTLSQRAVSATALLTLGAALSAGLLGAAAWAHSADVRADQATMHTSVPSARAAGRLVAVHGKHQAAAADSETRRSDGHKLFSLDAPRGARPYQARPSAPTPAGRSAARPVPAHSGGSPQVRAARRRRLALGLDEVFDPDFIDGTQPLPAHAQGFIEQSIGTGGTYGTAGGIALPLSHHWAASLAFAHGTSEAFAYGAVPGGPGQPQRIGAVPGTMNYTALHAQVMFHSNSHFSASFAFSADKSNMMFDRASKAPTVNY